MRTTDAFRICPTCGQETPANARFCMHCAAPVAQQCPACGSEAPPTARFCPNCAQALNPNAKQAPVTASGTIASGTAGETEEKRASTAGLFNAAAASQQLFKEGETHLKAGHPEQALAAFEQAIQRDERNAHAYRGKGDALSALKRYEEALAAYDRAMVLDPANAISYGNKGAALYHLQRYEEALRFLEQGIQRDPKDTALYNNKGAALRQLRRYQEALAAFDQTIQLDPRNVNAYTGKGNVLNSLQRPGEAQAAFDRANRLKAGASQPLTIGRSDAPVAQSSPNAGLRWQPQPNSSSQVQPGCDQPGRPGYAPPITTALPKLGGNKLLFILLAIVVVGAGVFFVFNAFSGSSQSPSSALFDRHGLPDNVPLPDNVTFKGQSQEDRTSGEYQSWFWSVASPNDPETVEAFYKTALPQKGWTPVNSLFFDFSGEGRLVAVCQSNQLLVANMSFSVSDFGGHVGGVIAPQGGSALKLLITSDQRSIQKYCTPCVPGNCPGAGLSFLAIAPGQDTTSAPRSLRTWVSKT